MTSSPDRGVAPLESLARQTGFSVDAVAAMRDAVEAGGGRMAQFDHPEFGGSGQWMQGGLLMISDFSDHALKARVGALCDALAAWLASAPAPDAAPRSFQRQSQTRDGTTRVQDSRDGWWPATLGTPDASGTQDGTRYAWFGGARRLVVDDGNRVTTYDTGDHRIDGVSQQQGSGATMSFASQHGPIDLGSLAVVPPAASAAESPAGAAGSGAAATPAAGGAARYAHSAAPPTHPAGTAAHAAASAATPSGDPFVALERLADLHGRGIVDAAEFAAKKAELLKRI